MRLSGINVPGRFAAVIAVLLLFSAAAALDTAPPADLVLTNGKLVTVDEARPLAEAIAVRNGFIVAVGEVEDIRPYIGDSTRVIDLNGALAVPGLIEGHAHFLGLGQSAMELDLTRAKTWDEIVTLVGREVQNRRPGEWILGRGWHQDKWTELPSPAVDGLPYHHTLSAASPDNPVVLTHASGHSCIANAQAMALADISRDTPNPAGGEIVRDAQGDPIGVFLESAQTPIWQAYDSALAGRTSSQIEQDDRRMIDLAVQACVKNGITTFHDGGATFATIDLYRRSIDEGTLLVRLWVMIDEPNQALKERAGQYRMIGAGDNHLTVRAVKRMIDGALGSHGAWLLEPYADLPSSTGMNTESLAVMAETAEICIARDLQMCTHAIGDRGNREVLTIYEQAFHAHPEKTALRWRLEHAQHLHPDDIPRFGRLAVIAAMQGVHCTSDGPWVRTRLGDKRVEEGAYAWKKLMQTGAVIVNGTDAPVENISPVAGYYASVTRRLPDGTVLCPDQCMTREEALQSYTINAAYAAFEEHLKGSLTPGKLADITVLSRDIMTIPEEQIPGTEILYTIIGGRIVYQK
jgi:predicted amidohydrolase YtcJ